MLVKSGLGSHGEEDWCLVHVDDEALVLARHIHTWNHVIDKCLGIILLFGRQVLRLMCLASNPDTM
jgi:hypothetical protein